MVVAAALQACDESLAKQSALQLAHRQQVAQLEDAVHVLKQQVSEAAVVVVVLLLQVMPHVVTIVEKCHCCSERMI
jgi:hypothetical protein